MFNPLKIYQYYKDSQEKGPLLERLAEKQKQIISEQKRYSRDPKKIVENCFKKGIKWYDYEEQAIELRKKYFQEAKSILDSDVFNNEKNFLIATGAEQALLDAMEPQQLRDFQMTINGMELLQNRLEEIKDPTVQETKRDIHAGL